MPSTYSTNLALELIATGEKNNTWGITTNTNLGTLLEQSITSSGSVPIADANTTIAMTNGASAAARCIVLSLSGALTAQRDLTVPTVNKPYIVYNGTTGGYGVQVKTAAGTGIVVPNGKRRFLYVDGTNVVEMLDSIAALTVAGALSVGGFALSLAGTFTTSGANALTLTTTGATNVTLPLTGTLATLAGAETLSNKTLTTPILGVATATSINKVALTAPATGSTLTIADGKTLTASNTLAFTGTDSTSFAFPGSSDTVATLAASQTLTNKTLTAPIADVFKVNASNVNAQTGTTYTLLDSDNGKTVTLSNASAITLTLPSGLTAGFSCALIQLGAGQVTITASGTTLRSRNGLKLGGQYAQAGVLYIASETYSVGGDLTT